MSYRLLISTPLYHPDIGGPATYTAQLESVLPDYGIESTVVSFGLSRNLPKGIRHIHFFLRVCRMLWNVDVVLAQDTVSVGLPTVCAAKLLRKKIIIRVPGDYAWEQSVQRFGVTETIDVFQNSSYGWKVRALRRLQTWVVTQAHVVITPSQYFGKLVMEWGVSDSKVRVIYNGINTEETPVPPVLQRRKNIITAGRLVPWKGFEALILMMEEIPDWQLIIAGEGPDRERLENIASKYGVGPQVTFLGRVPRPELLGWCKEADAFVLNTKFESFSFQTVEAMLAGAALIVTRVGSLPELITDGVEGVLVDPDDIKAIKSALFSTEHSPQVWTERKINAKRKSSQFSIGNTGKQVADVITEICH